MNTRKIAYLVLSAAIASSSVFAASADKACMKKAKEDYNTAVKACKDKSGADKKACKKDAKAAYTSAKEACKAPAAAPAAPAETPAAPAGEAK
jgi:hypothetical protein